MTDSPKLIFDADMTLYLCTTATECSHHWGNDLWILGGNLQEACDLFDRTVDDHMKRFDTDDVIMCTTGRNNYRKDVDPLYKSNRKSTRKPLLYPMLMEHMQNKYCSACEDSLEADDLCGIYATDPTTGPNIIISDDKDMFTIPASTYRLGELHSISPDEAWRTWMIQTLTGDATDGYHGAKGYGPVKADRALSDAPLWEEVVKCYERAGMPASAALRNARLARILQHGDYDFETKEVTLWQPPE